MLQSVGSQRVRHDLATEQFPSNPGQIIKSWGLLEKVVVTQRQIPTARDFKVMFKKLKCWHKHPYKLYVSWGQ